MEHWKPILGYEGRYEVSDHGNVRTWRRGGKNSNLAKPRLLRQQEAGPKNRTLRPKEVRLFDGERQRPFLVHRLVLLAFVGPCPAGMETRHLNDNRHDNRLENLAWGTRLENWEDRKRNGLGTDGERNGRAKLDWKAVREIRKIGDSMTQVKLAERYGVHQGTISAVLCGKLWPELNET